MLLNKVAIRLVLATTTTAVSGADTFSARIKEPKDGA